MTGENNYAEDAETSLLAAIDIIDGADSLSSTYVAILRKAIVEIEAGTDGCGLTAWNAIDDVRRYVKEGVQDGSYEDQDLQEIETAMKGVLRLQESQSGYLGRYTGCHR